MIGGDKVENLVNRFINYVKMETTSDESSIAVPSTPNQLEFANKLAKELKEIGLSDVSVDEDRKSTRLNSSHL